MISAKTKKFKYFYFVDAQNFTEHSITIISFVTLVTFHVQVMMLKVAKSYKLIMVSKIQRKFFCAFKVKGFLEIKLKILRSLEIKENYYSSEGMITNPLVTSNESLWAPSNLVVELKVEPESVETTPDAPLNVSIQEKELFLQSVFDHVNSSFPELVLTIAVDGNSSSPVLTIMQKNYPLFGLTSRIQVVIQYKCYTTTVLMKA